MAIEPEKIFKEGGRVSRFTVVGVSNAVVDWGMLNVLLLLLPTGYPWQFTLYNALALALANVNSYVWNSLWTFGSRARHDRRQAVLFGAQALVNVLVNTVAFWLLVRVLLDYDVLSALAAGNMAKILSVVLATLFSFFALRFVVFSRKRRFGKWL